MGRNHKLYRMMLEAYDASGAPFWHFVQELFLINYWDDIIPDDETNALYLAIIPEAQELMNELLRRGLVHVTCTHGFPPPSSGQFRVTEKEVEEIIADTQNWVGPLGEGPSATYYSFCSTLPGASITESSLDLLGANMS